MTSLDVETRELLIRLDERTERMEKDFDDRGNRMEKDIGMLKHVLIEGNGVPAVTVQLATLAEQVSTLKSNERDYRIPRYIWLGIVVSALIGLAGIIVSLKNW
jgi:hypothetical protein